MRLRRLPAGTAWLGGLAVACGLGLWIAAGGWGGGPLSGDDTAAHMIRARFALEHITGQGRIDGWQTSFILGYQEFLFIGPGFTWAALFVRVLSLGTLSLDGAFKITALATFAGLPLSVAFLVRSFGLSRRAAVVAAILSLGVNNPFGGVGLQGLFNVGLVTHQFAGPLFFLSLGGVVRLLRGAAREWTIFTGLSTGALLVSHGISVIVLGVVLAIFFVFVVLQEVVDRRRGDKRSALLRPPAAVNLAVAAVIALGVAACVLLPFAGHHDLRGIMTDWGTPPLGSRLLEIWRGKLLFREHTAVFVVAGFAYMAMRALTRKPMSLALLLTPVTYVVLAHVALHQARGNVLAHQLPNRGLGYIGVLAMVPLAVMIAGLSRRLGPVGGPAAVATAVALVFVPMGNYRDLARQLPEPIPQLRAAADVLARSVPPGARFATERDFPAEIERTRITNPDRWLAWYAGRDTLNAFNVESSQTPKAAYESEHVKDRSPEDLAFALSRLGTTHFVTVSDETAARLEQSPGFAKTWQSAPIAVFSVIGPAGHPSPAALVSTTTPSTASIEQVEPEHVIVNVNSSGPTDATIAIGWSPKWHARIDGRSMTLRKDAEGLLAFHLPGGAHRLEFDFRSDGWDRAGALVSLVTLIAITLWYLRLGPSPGGQGESSRFGSPIRWRRNRSTVPSVPNP